MRTDVSFESHGITCRGWLYKPEGGAGAAPAILMSHGFSAVKEQGLDGFARGFRDAGFVVLAFDYRFLGASDGTPRGRIIPSEQHDDNRAALAWLSKQPGVDPTRIGIWGSSYSGGHALFMGAMDPRIKVVVAQVPAIHTAQSLIAMAGREGFNGYLDLLAQDHETRNAGQPGGEIPVVAPEGEPSVLATADSYAWFQSSGARDAPNWLNSTSLESVARLAEYWPAAFIDLISPKPLLIQAASQDTLIPIDQVRAAFARAGEPKKMVEFAGGHFDLYPGEPFHEPALANAVGWFTTHL
jgi:dienelactone hydrolase